MKRFRIIVATSILGYLISLLTSLFVPEFINLLIPVIISIIGYSYASRIGKLRGPVIPVQEQPPASQSLDQPTVQTSSLSANHQAVASDPIWAPVSEYIHVIEEMVMSEGHKGTLDDEIIEKTMSLLARITLLIPQLRELNDSNVNHKIQRLIFKDLNGVINPFLKLSGEAKLHNRRLLLNGIKDINSTLSTYVETIEQRDLIELQTRLDLIQQRYRSTD